jgi:two-component system LytT family response regulator
MIKAIIIDDEAHCIMALQNDLKMCCPSVQVVATCHSAKEGLLDIKKFQPDVIFLDVEMPWMNGFEMLEVIGEINFQIIFTTAYDQFAARAFRVSAADYLLKPIDSEDLCAAVAKVEGLVASQRSSNNTITNLLNNARLPAVQQKMAIPNRNGYDFIAINDILYCKAEGAYTHVVLMDKKMILSKSLGETEQMLPTQLFERAHHSLLVNISHIESYSKADGASIIMSNGEELTVSRTRREQLLLRLGVR